MKTLLAFAAVLLAAYIAYQYVDNFDPESIRGKKVVITGASSGIGEQLAYQYARLGADVVLTGRREKKLKEVIDKCKTDGKKDGQYHYIPLDMGNSESPKQLIEFAGKSLGGIDILVLNHAMYKIGNWLGTPENISDFYKVMDVNFRAYLSAASYAIPALKRSKGNIIAMNSPSGKMGTPFMISYSTAQHGIEGFFGGLREEFISTNTDIAITMVSLGFIGTEGYYDMLPQVGGGWLMKYLAPASPSDTALAVIKGGASRVQRFYFPYSETRPIEVLCNIIPQTVGRLNRYVWEK